MYAKSCRVGPAPVAAIPRRSPALAALARGIPGAPHLMPRSESRTVGLTVSMVLVGLLSLTSRAWAECHPVGRVDTNGYARAVVSSGGYALVADGLAGLAVMDVGDHAHPTIAGTVSFPDGGWSLHLAVAGPYAYCGGDSLRIVDWADPTHPAVVGTIFAGWPYGVAVQGNFVYVADHNYGLKIVDVSDPTHPVLIGQVPTPGPGSVHRVSVDGTHAYLVGCSYRLFVVDVADPTQPQLVGESPFLPGAYEGIVVQDGLVYTSGLGPMRIFDVQVPSQPTLVGTAEFASGRALAYSWPFVYVSSGYDDDDTAPLIVLNVAQPASPGIVRTVDGSGYAWGLATDGSYVYGAIGDGGFCVLTTELEPAGAEVRAWPAKEANLTVVPNPSRGPAMLWCDLTRGGPGRLEVFDSAGRLLRGEDVGLLPAGRSGIPLTGLDEAGRPLPPGMHYLRLVRPGGTTHGRMVVLP